jgi:hypothetical protein
MKDLYYIGKETTTGKRVYILKEDYDALGEKAATSLKDMGVEVDTSKIVIKDIPDDEPEIGSKEYFDKYDCWDAIGGDWEG